MFLSFHMSLTIAVQSEDGQSSTGIGNNSWINPSTYAFIHLPQNPSGKFSLFQVFSSNRSLRSRSQDDLNLFGEYYISVLRIVKTMETKISQNENNSCHTAVLHTMAMGRECRDLHIGFAFSSIQLTLVDFHTLFFSLLVGKFFFF